MRQSVDARVLVACTVVVVCAACVGCRAVGDDEVCVCPDVSCLRWQVVDVFFSAVDYVIKPFGGPFMSGRRAGGGSGGSEREWALLRTTSMAIRRGEQNRGQETACRAVDASMPVYGVCVWKLCQLLYLFCCVIG